MADGAEARPPTLVERSLGALLELARSRDKIPEFFGNTVVDCALAGLASVLGLHGKHVSLEQLRPYLPEDNDGVTVHALVQAARQLGLRARPVEVAFEQLALLPRGTILHWQLNHFVVLDRVMGSQARILDAAVGTKDIPLEEASKAFTGVAVLLEPGDAFERTDTRPSPLALVRRAVDRGLLLRVMVVSAWLQLLAFVLPFLTGFVVDRLLPRRDWELFRACALGLVVVVAFRGFTLLVRSNLLMYLRTRVHTELVLGLFEHLVQLPLDFFRRRPTGDLMAHNQSIDYIKDAFSVHVTTVVLDGVFALGAVTGLCLVDLRFGLIALAWSALDVGVVLTQMSRFSRLSATHFELNAEASTRLYEMISGIQTVKASGADLRVFERWNNAFVNQLNVRLKLSAIETRLAVLSGMVRVAAPATALLLGAWFVLKAELSLGTMLAVNALSVTALTAFSSLAETLHTYLELPMHLQRVQDVLGLDLEQQGARAQGHRLQGRVQLEQVSFQYGLLSPKVLDGVSLEVPPGQFLAIVGPSGSGKTTLGNLLVGLDLPSAGTVRFDGADLRELDLRALRQQIGFVNQKTFLLRGTVRENITLFDGDIPLERVKEAARLAEIDADIEALPFGYHSLLMEDGNSLSGGQRQRLALARALVRRPALLLLDEATSALDGVTERKVQQNLDQLSCTRIVIAHRLSTIRNADLILLMEAGKIVEWGTHAQLMELGQRYARLVASQVEA
jgi:ABC-type bacteriocin/lantibiotic exporter with double-glycine peptidase domain